MSDDKRLRDLFAEAAAELPVTHPPDLAGMAKDDQRRSLWVPLAIAGLSSTVVIGVVSGVALQDRSRETGVLSPLNRDSAVPSTHQRSAEATVPTSSTTMSLSCPNDTRTISVWEAPGPSRATPQELIDLFANSMAAERAIMGATDQRSATAFIVRDNGSVRAVLTLIREEQGWRLGKWEACSDSWVRLER